MADYTVIPDSSLSPGAPARAVDARAMRDNSAAIAEGAKGAPRIETDALDDECVEYAKTELGLVSPFMESGTTYPFRKQTISVPDNTTRRFYFRFGVLGAGVFQYRLTPPLDPTGTITVYIVVNGVDIRTISVDNDVQYGWFDATLTDSSSLIEVECSGNSNSNNYIAFEFAVANYQSIPRYINIED